MSEELTFEGFEPANTTPVPDVLFDKLLSVLSGAELKVLLYIIRRTRGFKKESDSISLTQFTKGIKTRDGKQLDKGCGISNRTVVSAALASLEDIGCICRKHEKHALGDDAPTLYTIRFREQGVVSKPYYPSIETVPGGVSETYYGSTETALPVVSKPYPQETVLQQTDRQESTYAQSATAIAPRTQHIEEDGRDDDGSSATDRTILARGESNGHGPHDALGDRGTAGPLTDIPDPQPLTTHSYSQNRAIGKTDVNIPLSDKPAELQKTKTPVEAEKPKRPPRKPKACGTPEEMVRINKVFDAFDEIARECFCDPTFSYGRPKTDCDHIKTFLALSPTPTVEKLKAHYRVLFAKPKSRDGFLWSENMSIAAVCRDYGRKPQIVSVVSLPKVASLTPPRPKSRAELKAEPC